MALVKNISCYEAVALISDYLEGALSMRSRRRLEHHLSVCDACSAYLEQMRVTIALTGKVGPEDLAPDVLSTLLEVFDHYRNDATDEE